MELPYEQFGLTGRTVSIRTKNLMPESMLLDSPCVDPWRWGEQRAYVVQECEKFITLEIQPHSAPIGWGESALYPTTIHKSDIYSGAVIVKTLDGNNIMKGGVKREEPKPEPDGRHWHDVHPERSKVSRHR